MTVIYRVRVHPIDGADIVYEGFETKSDSDAFWAETLDNDRLFDRLPFDVAVAEYEEFYLGQWVKRSVKTVIR